MEIQHWSHPHPLTFSSPFPGFASCAGCGGRIPTYACGTCNFYIHRSCAEMPTQINHPLHPDHPLTLRLPSSLQDSYSCDACGVSRLCFYYSCSECGFDLDLRCSSLSPAPPSSTNQQGLELHHCHRPLILCNSTHNSSLKCSICRLPLDPKSIYVCLECHLLLHTSCAELPKQIQHHPFHPQHPLTIRPLGKIPTRERKCHACGNPVIGRGASAVTCSHSCDFILHVTCLFLKPTKTAEPRQSTTPIQHLGQNHPLFFCDISDHHPHGFTRFCSACALPFKPHPIMTIYVCTQCKVLLHPCCSKWPLKINHPFHPQHPLSLFSLPTNVPMSLPHCRACEDPPRGCMYGCSMDNCSFSLHVRCASLLPTIVSELHQHRLLFYKIERTPVYQHPCTACQSPIMTFYLRCVQCDLNWHFRCCPTILPPTIKHECHRDPLTLTTSPIKDREDEGEDAELNCDACEEARKLAETTYYCAQCHYVAHVDCVLSEVLRVLEERSLGRRPGDVKLEASINVVTNENIEEVVGKVCLLEMEGEKQDIDATPTPTPNEEAAGATGIRSYPSVFLDKNIADLQQQIDAKKAELEALIAKREKLQNDRAKLMLVDYTPPKIHPEGYVRFEGDDV